MKSIETHFVSMTDYRPSRIVATDGDNRIVVSCQDELTSEQNHALAARTLKNKLGWPETMHGGHTKKGMVWIFPNEYLC
jgi:hypothetical protein